jgi:hypothetical protein
MKVSFDYPAYNARRYGRPWGAVVKFEGVTPKYDFSVGNYLGNDRGGKVYVECEPGDIVATGQKDFRGGHTISEWYIVQEDGSLVKTDKAGALDHWDSRKKESPLAKYSTEELIAELRRRGIDVNLT